MMAAALQAARESSLASARSATSSSSTPTSVSGEVRSGEAFSMGAAR